MAEHWLQTDEHEEAVSALETVAEWSSRIEVKLDFWRWVVLALHDATQGFMVLALRGSNGLRPLKNKDVAKWHTAYREDVRYSAMKLDSFLDLYKKIKSDSMLFFVYSKKFVASGTQDSSIKKLNAIRNDFIHFLPRSWSLEVTGLPGICLDCLAVIYFLGWECGNVLWHKEEHQQRAYAAINVARHRLEQIDNTYTSDSA